MHNTLNSQQYSKENDMVEILDVKHCLNFSNNVLQRLDYHTYTPISFVQPKKDFHCEAIYNYKTLFTVVYTYY